MPFFWIKKLDINYTPNTECIIYAKKLIKENINLIKNNKIQKYRVKTAKFKK